MTRVLIAALGAESQGISIATELFRRAETLDRVIVFRPSAEHDPTRSAHSSFTHFFANRTDLPLLKLVSMPIFDVLAPPE